MVTNEKELGKALKENKDIIEIEGDLSKKVIKIKATGKVAWGVCIGCISVAVVAIIVGTAAAPATAGITAMKGFAAGSVILAPAVVTLGAKVTTTAVLIAIAAGGAGKLNKLREYRIEKKDSDKIVLYRK